jgi:CRISPR-associated protein Csm4
MADYCIRLRLRSPLATPLHSGTLFGHLCWVLRYRDGETALNEWLAELPESPLLLSDAFPAGYLPRPLLAPGLRPTQLQGESRGVFRRRLEEDKRLRKTAWISVEDFLTLRNGLNEERLLALLGESSLPQGRKIPLRVAHNTIDRHTGTTPDSGGLYFMDEDWHDAAASEFEVYVKTELALEALQDLFSRVGELGFGRDASLGRGQFKAGVAPADRRLFDADGNRLLSLSHGLLSANMATPYYRLHTHYGKLSGLYAGSARSPFKHPLLLIPPGATFAPQDPGPFGALLRNVHPHHPEICHNAWHLCLPFPAV